MAGICLVQFAKSGLQVHFPYQHFAGTAVSRCEAVAGTNVQIDLGPGGGYAALPPKYAHHIDVRCHFSQDGKILTTVINQSHPLLHGYRGHIFTVDVQGLTYFSQPPTRRQYGTTEFEFAAMPSAIHLAFFWYRGGFNGMPPVGEITNPVALRQRGSPPSEIACLAMGRDHGTRLDDYVLLVHARPREPFFPAKDSALSLVGGFAADLADPTRASSLLVMRAPASDIAAELRSIDLAHLMED